MQIVTLESIEHWNKEGFDASGVSLGTVTVPSELFDKLLAIATDHARSSAGKWNVIAQTFLQDGNPDGVTAQEQAHRWHANLEVIEDLFDATR